MAKLEFALDAPFLALHSAGGLGLRQREERFLPRREREWLTSGTPRSPHENFRRLVWLQREPLCIARPSPWGVDFHLQHHLAPIKGTHDPTPKLPHPPRGSCYCHTGKTLERHFCRFRLAHLASVSKLCAMWRFCLLFLLLGLTCASAAEHSATFPIPTTAYGDDDISGVMAQLKHRIKVDPFNLIATGLFLAAIVHTFLVSRFTAISHYYERRYEELEGSCDTNERECDRAKFRAQLFHFMGEVEAVFGLWLVPLFGLMIFFKGMPTLVSYVHNTQFAEPVFVGVIMAISASRPILALAENSLRRIASIGGGSPAAWWVTILTLGPLLGSFITEPAAMTLCALLLCRQFYSRKPGETLKYATLGLLFVNVSVGGLLTPFAAPPVIMVAGKWGWDFAFMASNFGWKVVLGIIIANTLYFLIFRKQLRSLTPCREPRKTRPIPMWITIGHVAFLAWTVVIAHYPALVVLSFLFFLAFTEATGRHQSEVSIRSPLLVGFFLASLILHGGGQQWWIAPILSSLGEWPMALGALALSPFNDNAAITYLATLVPNLADPLKYAVVAGAVAGGGLTVIANAPNPAGQAILSRYFADGVAPSRLFLAALVPTIIMLMFLMLFR